MEKGGSTELPDRIEIELVEHAVPGPRRRWRHADEPAPAQPVASHGFELAAGDEQTVVVTSGPVGGGDGALGSERRRLVVTALAAGVVALFIGWALGRSGGSGEIAGDDSSKDPSATTNPVTTEPADDLGEEVPPVASGDLPVTPLTTIARPGPTTTLPPEWVDDVVEISDARLAMSGLELVVLTARQLQTVDLTTGARSTFARNSPGSFVGGPPRPVFAGDDWIMVYNAELQRAELFEGRAPLEDFLFGSNAQVVYRPGSDTFQIIEQTATTDGALEWTVSEVAYDGSGQLYETTFELPPMSWVQSTDPAGGLIVYAQGGGIYHSDGATSQRLTSGMLLGLNATTMVVSECGETLGECRINIVDRATGERRELPEATGAPSTFEPVYGYWGTMLENISPTGEYIAVMSSGMSSYQFGLLSLTTGEFVPLVQPMGDALDRVVSGRSLGVLHRERRTGGL